MKRLLIVAADLDPARRVQHQPEQRWDQRRQHDCGNFWRRDRHPKRHLTRSIGLRRRGYHPDGTHQRIDGSTLVYPRTLGEGVRTE